MRWKYLEKQNGSKFKRMTGVTKKIFKMMVEVIKKDKTERRVQKGHAGRKNELSAEEKVLVTLMYYREYRTQAHIGASYEVSEATINRTINHVETLLLQDKRFHVPGKKKLKQTSIFSHAIVVDVSESAIERPKKNKGVIIQEKRRDTL